MERIQFQAIYWKIHVKRKSKIVIEMKYTIYLLILINYSCQHSKTNNYLRFILEDDASMHNYIFIPNENGDSFTVTSINRLIINLQYPTNYRDTLYSLLNSKYKYSLYQYGSSFYKTIDDGSYKNYLHLVLSQPNMKDIDENIFTNISEQLKMNIFKYLFDKGYLIRKYHDRDKYYIIKYNTKMNPQNLTLYSPE